MRVTAAAILAILLAALLVSGCGGGGDSDPLSKTAFLKQGNEVCAKAGDERDAEGRAFAENEGGSNDEELESYVSEVVAPSVDDMTSELGDLGAPKADAKQVEKIIAGYEGSLGKLESEPKLALEGNPFAAPNKMAEDYGLSDCVI
jgi:hypothetical protein